jgi:hypothetical protein
MRDRLRPIADQLQYFVQDKTLCLEQVALGVAACSPAPAADLLVETRESKQCAQSFLARD